MITIVPLVGGRPGVTGCKPEHKFSTRAHGVSWLLALCVSLPGELGPAGTFESIENGVAAVGMEDGFPRLALIKSVGVSQPLAFTRSK